MSAVGHSPPPFFRRGPAPLAQLAFFVTASIMLIVADVRFDAIAPLRYGIALATSPLQQAASFPLSAGGQMGSYFTRLSAALAENTDLQKRQLDATKQLLRQHYLEDENKRLRALLDMREQIAVDGKIAEILYAARDPFSRKVVIDKGSQQGIEEGQAVVDDAGVIGQVIRAFPLTSEVALLTDNNHAVPVRVERNGLRAVLVGAGSGRMELKFLAVNAEIQAGDRLVTSGLDGIFLPGLPVAKISKIDRDSSYDFARVFCEPLAGVEKHGLVLVLGSRPAQPERPAELDAPAVKSGTSGRAHRRVSKAAR
jgi:rod shape-determining protein MreC